MVDPKDLIDKYGPCTSVGGGKELLFSCPRCGKQKLYINPRKSKGFCQRCHLSLFLKDLQADPFNNPLYKKPQEVERRTSLGLPEGALPLWERRSKSSGYLSYIAWETAFKYVEGRGFDAKDMERYYLHYCEHGCYGGRIIFPLTYQGEVYSFIARDYENSSQGRAIPKVLNAPRSVYYEEYYAHMGVDLCCSQGVKDVVLVEGPFDCMAVGSPPAIALHGTNISEDFMVFLLKHFQNFVLMLDPDDAGRTASKEIEETLSRSGRVVVSPLNMADDPAGLGKAEARKIATRAIEELQCGAGIGHKTCKS